MKCKKCGKEVSKTDLFCQYCGTKVEVEETSKKTEKVKAEKVKTEKVEDVKVGTVKEEKANTTGQSNAAGKGFAIASMSLGIIGIILTFVWGPFAFVLSLLGLIFAIVSKKKCGFKTAGLITSIVGLALQVIATILIVFFFSTFMAIFADYIDSDLYSYKNDNIHGEWTCKPYPSYSYSSSEETTLKLNYDGTYIYGPKNSLNNNYYSGEFTYESEYDKNLENYSKGSKFYDIDADVDKFVMNGISLSTYGKSLDMEMELVDDYDTAYIMFYNTSDTYKCER